MPADRCISFWENEDGCDYIPPWIDTDIDIGIAFRMPFFCWKYG